MISGQGMGDSTVSVVVDSSLRMVNSFTQAVLLSLGVCPEDVRSFASLQVCELCCYALGVDQARSCNGDLQR